MNRLYKTAEGDAWSENVISHFSNIGRWRTTRSAYRQGKERRSSSSAERKVLHRSCFSMAAQGNSAMWMKPSSSKWT